ncbi:MAG TPA: FecR domain-containing protein [Polyangiaceae bacterium]|nr:FecR domain-containing protein [Polyangiaceae bacterium]
MSEHQRIELRGLKVGWNAARTERLLDQVHSQLEGQQRRWRAALASASLVVLVLIGGAVWHFQRAPGVAATPKSAPSIVVGAPDPSALVLRDGSEIQLDPRTSTVRVAEESASKVRIELERGSARYEVTPHPERSFEVHAGSVTVTVVGTAFLVERRGESTWVEVSRGKVRVSWNESEPVFLVAGESGLFPRGALPSADAASPSDNHEGNAAPEASDKAPEASDKAPAATRAQQASVAYRAHIARHDYRGAYAVLSQNPGLAGDTVQDLLLAADVARLSAHPADAVPYLQSIVRNHAQDARAPMAAFTLGRTLSGLGRTREALNMFGKVRSSWPKSSLAEDALIRQAEASAQLGDYAAAARFAAQYDREYPQGRRRAEVRRYAHLE